MEERVLKSVKVEAPSFDGQLNPKVFLDWLSDMDHFFAWYDMSEARQVRFAKMKLVGQAKLYWINVERQLERAREEPITLWAEMKERLREKYVPLSYHQQLLDKWQSLRQGSMLVTEYISKFEEFMLRCNVTEDASVTLSRFRTGLRLELQRELIPHDVDSLERAYQIVIELERYLNLKAASVIKKASPHTMDSRTSTLGSKSNSAPKDLNAMYPSNNKGKGVSKDAQGRGTQKCYKCQGFGHFAAQCPTKEATRNMLATSSNVNGEEGEYEEEVYEPDFETSDPNLEDDEDDNPQLGVVRCTLAQPKSTDDWRRTSIFHTYVKSGDKSCKLIIDNGSCINVVSSHTISLLSLTPVDHPQPYRVAWIETSSIPVTQRCKVPIQFLSYKDVVWCDVVPMNAGHILLGRPWLYDHDVTIFGRTNSCSFIHNGKKITLNPVQPKLKKESVFDHENQKIHHKKQTKSLHIVVSTRQGGYQKFLIKWKNRPDSDNTWVTKEELQRIDPDILERYYSFISSESISSQPGRIDEDINSSKFKVYHRKRTLTQLLHIVTLLVLYIRVRRISSRDLSASWVWKNPGDEMRSSQVIVNSHHFQSQTIEDPFQRKLTGEDSSHDNQSGSEMPHPNETDERSDHNANAYAITLARANNETMLYDSLMKHYRKSQLAIGEATTDAEHHASALDQAKAMGHILATAKDQLYECAPMAKMLRAKPLHCIPLILTTDYYLNNFEKKDFPYDEKLENPSLYHYAIFSDNILATSVGVNSTVLHAKEPKKHVFSYCDR
ncbi:hypothetical protein RD792_017070 [Penstemon davidsonii]|uniref:CCHC-type domain-containing protein n=1 Tax=Penstemon davidsonii TaxID=160366 RepID=A0ABR0CMP3_9LAMI|nr:hypothetical protein RD792_017070 [Penstemon davidsonii]